MQNENFFIDDNHIPVGFETDGLRRLLKNTQLQQQGERERLEQVLQAWQQKYRAAERQLIGYETREKLNDYVTKNRRPDSDTKEKPGLITVDSSVKERKLKRLQSLQFAHDIGLDMAGLARLRQAASHEIEQIINPASFSTNRIVIEQPDNDVLYQPFQLAGAKPMEMKSINFPLYPGWWDRSAESYQSGDGQALRNDSYLWHEASRSGSCIWSKNKSAGDFDYLVANRENGFLVPYQTTQNGILKIKFDVECAFTEHCIQTWDEWGWSEHNAWTNEKAVASVFWNWEDVDPATESADSYFVWGLDSSGDGESSPGVVHPVPAAQERTLTFYTNMSFPTGANLWIYVGTRQLLYATLNDVSINMFVNSGWYVKSIDVTSV